MQIGSQVWLSSVVMVAVLTQSWGDGSEVNAARSISYSVSQNADCVSSVGLQFRQDNLIGAIVLHTRTKTSSYLC